MGTGKNRVLAVGAFVFALLPIVGVARAGTIATDAVDFAALAGGQLSTGEGVRVGGMVGGSGVWLGQSNVITGDLLSSGEVGLDRASRVEGRVSAGGGMTGGRDSGIGGGIDAGHGVWLDRDVRAGGVTAGGSVSLSRGVRIDGGISHGGSYWADREVTVTGPVAANAAEPDLWQGSVRAQPSMAAGSGSRWVGREEALELSPGAYGSLSMDRETTLRLTSGSYTFQSMWLGREARIIAETTGGPITIEVVGDFSVDREFGIEAEPSMVAVRVGRSISVGRESRIDASLIGFGDVSIDRDTLVGGQVYAGRSLWLDSGVEVMGRALMGTGGGTSQIPEPATGLVMLAGAAVMAGRGRGGERRGG